LTFKFREESKSEDQESESSQDEESEEETKITFKSIQRKLPRDNRPHIKDSIKDYMNEFKAYKEWFHSEKGKKFQLLELDMGMPLDETENPTTEKTWTD
jgi:hypothetical protein